MAKSKTYDEFVEKFKVKHTTDDCFTPDYIYKVVEDYVEQSYGISRDKFVRPFWPGEDYTAYIYPDDCVVVDNPPFSISSQILQYYNARGIKYFLFCSHLTALSSMLKSGEKSTFLGVGYSITYENGAKVNTSFFTNLEPLIIARSDSGLFKNLKQAEEAHNAEVKPTLPKYVFPDNVLTASELSYMSKNGIDYECKRCAAVFVSKLDSQKQAKKTIFGGGILMSEKAAAEKVAAEKVAAEKVAAEKVAAEKVAAEKVGSIVWALSDREKEIVRQLGESEEAQKTA